MTPVPEWWPYWVTSNFLRGTHCQKARILSFSRMSIRQHEALVPAAHEYLDKRELLHSIVRIDIHHDEGAICNLGECPC
jgi:hypothetical protein